MQDAQVASVAFGEEARGWRKADGCPATADFDVHELPVCCPILDSIHVIDVSRTLGEGNQGKVRPNPTQP